MAKLDRQVIVSMIPQVYKVSAKIETVALVHGVANK